MKGRVEPDHNGLIVGGGDQMAISVNEIAQQSGAVLDQIRSYPINWSLASIASLIGHSGSSAFRPTTTTAVSMSLTGSCFSSELTRPFHHGSRRRGGTIYRASLL